MPALLALAATAVVLGLAAANPPGALWALPGIEAACALACLARGVLRPAGRLGWLGLGIGMALWSAGDIVYAAIPDLPTPSVADALWLAFYPPTYAGLVFLARGRLSGAGVAVWLDGLVVGLAVAAIAAAVVVAPACPTTAPGRATRWGGSAARSSRGSWPRETTRRCGGRWSARGSLWSGCG